MDEHIREAIDEYLKSTMPIDEFLSVDQMRERQEQGHEYFTAGRLYQVRKNFMGLSARKTPGGNKKKIDLKRGEYLMCIKSVPSDRYNFQLGPPVGVIEFIFKENILRYVTDANSLCCMLDEVDLEDEQHLERT